MPEMVAPRALVFRPLVKRNEALGTRLTPTQRSCGSGQSRKSWSGTRVYARHGEDQQEWKDHIAAVSESIHLFTQFNNKFNIKLNITY